MKVEPIVRDTIDNILGDYNKQIYETKIDSLNYKELWHQHLDDKYLSLNNLVFGCIEAQCF